MTSIVIFVIGSALSGMAQSWGYFLAAFGPLALGVLHDLSSAWTVPLLLLLVVLVPHSVFSWLAGRPGVVGAQGTLHR